jgi:RNA polymerase sigma factor (TIGR02999 family)
MRQRTQEKGQILNSQPAGEITQLLLRWNAGEANCLNQLIPLAERELRRIAGRHMRGERQGHTLEATALVNEAYLKLVDQSRATWKNRVQFFAVAAGIMRRILIDHARGLERRKRGSGAAHLPLDELVFTPDKSAALVALDEALKDLARIDPRKARVVELRYFAGLSVEEAAEALGVHQNTVVRDWKMAKAWLARELRRETFAALGASI